jgi:23S rRNA (guanosine2251-2'-O)-methyltransferase
MLTLESEHLSNANQQSNNLNIRILLDDVRSMQNVGSVFRTADAFGIDKIYLCGYTPTPPHRDIHKTALGATETVNWEHYSSIIEAITKCKMDGYEIVSIEQVEKSTSLAAFKLNNAKVAIIMGNEVNGVSEDALLESDRCIEIPQFGAKHSLNISVATGVVIWELKRNILTQ